MLFLLAVFYGILCANINISDSALENTDTALISACFYHTGLFLDAYYLTDNAADGGYLIADLKGVTHLCSFLLLLFLGTDNDEIHRNEHDNDHYNGAGTSKKTSGLVYVSSFVKKIRKHFYSSEICIL